MTPLAELLKPYTLYLIYAQIFLLSLAIFVGAMLIIRRLWKRQPVEGALIQDREKLAAEIHEEILRLEDLRNRLDPSFMLAGQDIAARPLSSKLHSAPLDFESSNSEHEDRSQDLGTNESDVQETRDSERSTDGVSELEVQERIDKATRDLMDEISGLTEKLSKAEESLREQPSDLELSTQTPDSSEWDKLKAEIEELNLKLEDYRAFEGELALVKKYKAENEALRQQLAAQGGVTTEESLNISEDDIANLFAEMGSPSEEYSEEVSQDGIEAASEELVSDSVLEEDSHVEPEESEEPSLEAAAENIEETLQEDEAPEEFEKEALVAEPVIPEINEETAEALAELGDDDDALMAEFEKVLGTKEQEK